MNHEDFGLHVGCQVLAYHIRVRKDLLALDRIVVLCGDLLGVVWRWLLVILECHLEMLLVLHYLSAGVVNEEIGACAIREFT